MMEPAARRVALLRAELEAAEAELRVAKEAEVAKAASKQLPWLQEALDKQKEVANMLQEIGIWADQASDAGSTMCPTPSPTEPVPPPTVPGLKFLKPSAEPLPKVPMEVDDEVATVIFSDTTKVPSQTDGDSGPEEISDNETLTSRRSSCRTRSQKGANAKKKNAKRMEEFLRKKGLVPHHNTFDQKELALLRVQQATGKRGTEALETQAAVVEKQTADKDTTTTMRKCMEMPPDFNFDRPCDEEFTRQKALINAEAIKKGCCNICGGVAVYGPEDAHLRGGRHLTSLCVMAKLNQLMGAGRGGVDSRVYKAGLFVEANTPVQYTTVADYWGVHLNHFPRAAFQLAFSEGVKVKSRKSRPATLVSRSDILATNLCIVNYEGASTGVYDNSVDSRHMLCWPHSFPLSFPQRSQLWPLVLLSLKPEVQAEHQVIGGAGDDEFDPCSTGGELYMNMDDAEYYATHTPQDGWVDVDGKCVWAVCAYQATDSPPQAWPIRLRVNK